MRLLFFSVEGTTAAFLLAPLQNQEAFSIALRLSKATRRLPQEGFFAEKGWKV
jgi:hypothetical protein